MSVLSERTFGKWNKEETLNIWQLLLVVAHTLLCFVVLAHNTQPYPVNKRLIRRVRGHADLGSQEERGVLDELKPKRNIAVQ